MTDKKESEKKQISEISSEELGLRLAALFEQGFMIQQDIHAITAELKRRQSATKEIEDAAGKTPTN